MEKHVDIFITNIQLHVTEPRSPISPGRAIEKAVRSKKEHRSHTTDFKMKGDGKMRFIFHNPELDELRKKYEAEGKTVRFWMPKGGAPMYLGKDSVEFIKSKRWQNYLSRHPIGENSSFGNQ